MITHSLPYPLTGGAEQRTALLADAARQVAPVDLLVVSGKPAPEKAVYDRLVEDHGLVEWVQYEPIGRRGWGRGLRPLAPGLVDRLALHLGAAGRLLEVDPAAAAALQRVLRKRRYDLIIGRFLPSSAQAGADRVGLPVVLDVDDVPMDFWATRLSDPATSWIKAPFIRRHAASVKRVSLAHFRSAAAAWVVKEADRRWPGLEDATLLPNIPYSPPGVVIEPCLPNPSSRDLLFVGQIGHAPNRAGLNHFVAEVWPAVRAAVPGATLTLVGSRMADADRQRWGVVPGVKPVGFVEDLTQPYRDCAFTIAPLYSGAGSSIKVVESLARGRTVVATPQGARGHRPYLQHGESLLIAEDTAAYADACIRLLNTPDECQRLAEHGQVQVAAHLNQTAFQKIVRDTLVSVLAS